MLVISVSNSLLSSLVSRPFHQFVIACMQNGACKNGGGRPGQFYHVNDISVYLGRQRGGGVPGRRTSFGAFSKRKTREQNAYFRPGTPPPSVYLGRHQLIHMIKWTRPSPSVLPTASDQKLDDGKAWERGYLLSLLPWHVQWQTSFRSTHSWVARFTRNSVFQAILSGMRVTWERS